MNRLWMGLAAVAVIAVGGLFFTVDRNVSFGSNSGAASAFGVPSFSKIAAIAEVALSCHEAESCGETASCSDADSASCADGVGQCAEASGGCAEDSEGDCKSLTASNTCAGSGARDGTGKGLGQCGGNK